MTYNSPKNPFQKSFRILRNLLVVMAILLSCNLFSQEVNLKGKIGTTEDIDVEGINIYNLSTSKGTVTNVMGEFQIVVSINDSLAISAVHIQDKKIVIGAEQVKTKKIVINLSEKMNALSTVTIHRPLTGYLASDANIIPVKESITAKSMGLPNADLPKLTKSQRQLYTATTGPVDILVNALSGRTKMLKKQIELEKIAVLTLALLDKFPETYFTDGLKINKLEVYSFIFFCEDDPDYQRVMKRNSMDIIEFLEKKSQEYLKNR